MAKSLLLPILSPLIRVGASTVSDRFLNRNPVEEQRNKFLYLIRKAAMTRFGKDHGFAEMGRLSYELAYERFRATVPIRTYADFWRDYFSNCHDADSSGQRFVMRDVTWPGLIRLFCETSGTTAPTKHIPFSREMFEANRRAALDLMSCYIARNPGSRILGGRFLYMSGSTDLSALGNGIFSGDMSAITLRFAPSYLKPFICPKPEISSLPWEDKLESLARLLVRDRTITGISGVPPWILLLLQRCRAVGGASLAELLPNLELIIHGGTSIKPYRREFDDLFDGRGPRFLEVLPSSEAFMGFQVSGEQGMRLTPYYGAFYEFIPISHLGEQGQPLPGAEAVPLEEITEGERYAVILSTSAGLWRYHIGDTLQFTSKSSLHIEFTGRDRFLDRFEEKVTQSEVEMAVAELTNDHRMQVAEFMVSPDIPGRRHLWVLALKGDSSPDAEFLAKRLDSTLMKLNADYSAFRSQDRIKSPKVLTVGEETIYNWSRDVRGKLGGQSKIPHIDPTLEGDLVQSLIAYSGQQTAL